jgi:hypothetical protein
LDLAPTQARATAAGFSCAIEVGLQPTRRSRRDQLKHRRPALKHAWSKALEPDDLVEFKEPASAPKGWMRQGAPELSPGSARDPQVAIAHAGNCERHMEGVARQ